MQTPKARLILPKTLAYTAFRLAIGGALACSGADSGGAPAADASTADASLPKDAAGVDAVSERADEPSDPTMPDAEMTDGGPSDAPDDMVASETGTDACESVFCGPIDPDASCPGALCFPAQCPPGCEPLA
jgi:hypothetical protein